MCEVEPETETETVVTKQVHKRAPRVFKNVYASSTRENRYAFLSKAPDDVVVQFKDAPPVIPVKLRDDENSDFPNSDLLNALHYYIGSEYPQKAGSFDETSLLTLGLLVENWMEEIIGKRGHELYNEYVDPTERYLKEIQRLESGRERKRIAQEEEMKLKETKDRLRRLTSPSNLPINKVKRKPKDNTKQKTRKRVKIKKVKIEDEEISRESTAEINGE